VTAPVAVSARCARCDTALEVRRLTLSRINHRDIFAVQPCPKCDPDNGQRYVAMLRRARLMAGAHQVVFIAQQPEVWSAADAVLWVEDGRVEVRQ